MASGASIGEQRKLFDEKLVAEARASAEQIPAMEAAWEEERKKPRPNLDKKFTYAFVLSTSAVERHKVMGIRLLKELVAAKFNVDESLYAAAVAYYSMGKYGEARELVERLLRKNPDHRYANELHTYLKDAQAKQDLAIGVGVGLGIVTATAAVLLGAFLGGGRRGSR